MGCIGAARRTIVPAFVRSHAAADLSVVAADVVAADVVAADAGAAAGPHVAVRDSPVAADSARGSLGAAVVDFPGASCVAVAGSPAADRPHAAGFADSAAAAYADPAVAPLAVVRGWLAAGVDLPGASCVAVAGSPAADRPHAAGFADSAAAAYADPAVASLAVVRGWLAAGVDLPGASCVAVAGSPAADRPHAAG